MNVLAFDTVTESLSIALVTEPSTLTHDAMPGTGHGRVLLSEIETLLTQASMRLSDIDLLGVGVGPGSFTGLRIGVAAAQSIAFATGVPVIGVSSLAAMISASSDNHVLSLLDARMGEVYAGFYRQAKVIPNELPVLIQQETVCAPGVLTLPEISNNGISVDQKADWNAKSFSVVGPGWHRYETDFLDAPEPLRPQAVITAWPSATSIAAQAKLRYASGESGKVRDLFPSYVRNKVAQV